MAQTSTYIKIDQDALVEWVYDDSNNLSENYDVIVDELNGTSSFAFSEGSTRNNKLGSSLFQTSATSARWSVADPSVRSFIKPSSYTNAPVSRYDKLLVYFPIGFQFSTNIGFQVEVFAPGYDIDDTFLLASYYFDPTIQARSSELEDVSPPLRMQDRFWGRVVELHVPSLYQESRNRTNSRPTPGTVNYNLTGGISGIGLSQTAPVGLRFRWIELSNTVVGQPVYTLSSARTAYVAQAPTHQTLSVGIEKATDGDYFEICGAFNGTQAEFQSFMDTLEATGQRSYVVYTVTQYEENVQTGSVDYYVHEDFSEKISHRPVFKLSSTTSSVSVTMKLVNSVDGSVMLRTAELGLLPNETLRYGKTLMAINVANAFKPKIYNAKPDQIVAPPAVVSAASRRVQTQLRTQVVTKPMPVITSNANVVTKLVDNSGGYVGEGKLELVLHPYDNVLKIKVAKDVADNSVTPFEFPSNSTSVLLAFKSTKGNVEVPIMTSSREVDQANGVLVFNVKEADIASVKQKITGENSNFYIVMRNELATTVVYTGRFILSDSAEYRSRTITPVSPVKPVIVPPQPVAPFVNQATVSVSPLASLNGLLLTSSSIDPTFGTVAVESTGLNPLTLGDTQLAPFQYKLIL